MKNIHVIPTDKPSRLYLSFNNELNLDNYECQNTLIHKNQNIYLTSNGGIKVNDYITDGYKVWQWKDDSSLLGRKKVIITTDQDLIKDGVQTIPDEFLEWFVKNPSCEEVEYNSNYNRGNGKRYYKIIIPKEKPKYISTVEKFRPFQKIWQKNMEASLNPKQEYQSECICDGECREFVNVKCKKPKQETLEETAERLYPNYQQEIFINGAKWQQERSYSEKDMREAYKYGKIYDMTSFEEWFEQFKKK